MSSKTKSQLRTENNSSFPNNNTQFITPELLRNFNSDIIDSMVSNEDSGSFTVDTGSLLATASFDNGTRDMTFTKGDGSTFTTNIPGGTSGDTGSLLVTASVTDATITFTKGDASTFDITVNNVVSASHALNADNAISASHSIISDNAIEIFVKAQNTSGFDIPKGYAVHSTGVTGDKINITTASYDDPNLMPAIGITQELITNNAVGEVILTGRIIGINTATLTEGSTVYVNGDGSLTSTRPTGSALIQNIGTCVKSNATEGEILVLGAGRSNDLPNITSGYAWVGDSNGVPQAVATSSFTAEWDGTFTGSAEISGSLTIQDTLKVANGNATASLTAESELVEFLFKQNTFNSQTLITQDDGDGSQQFQQSKPGTAQTTLGFSGTNGTAFLQLENGTTDGTARVDDKAIKIINQAGSIDRQLILAAKSSDIGLSGDEPCIAIVSPSTEVEVFRFQNSSTYTDGTVAVLTPLSSSTDILSNTLTTNELTASLQEGYVFVGNSSGKTSEIQTSSLQTTIPSGTVSGSDQLTGSYDLRYFQLNANNTADGDNIFSGSITTAAGTTVQFNAQPSVSNFNQTSIWEFPAYSNLDGRGIDTTQSQMALYGNNTNEDFAGVVAFQFETSGSNLGGESRASFGPLANKIVVANGFTGQQASIVAKLDNNNNAVMNIGANNISLMTNPAVESAEVGNPASTVPIYMQQQFVFANPGDGYATPLTINIDGSLTASADISSSADLYGNNATIAGTLNLGNTIISGSVKTETAIQTISSLTASIDFSDTSMFELTLADSVDTHIDATNIGQGQTINVLINQAATTPGTVSFSPKFYFPSGSSYTATATAGARDILTLITFANENNVYVSSVNNMVQ